MTEAAPEYVAATTDAELALAPARLTQEPRIEKLLEGANFEQKGDPGIWWKTITIDGVPTDVEVDIMVPEHFAPAGGRRSVRLGEFHRSVHGPGHDDADSRQFVIRVAGPAALIATKVYELRRDTARRGLPNRPTARSMSQSPSTIAAATPARSPPRFARRTGTRPRQDSNLRSRLRRPTGPVCAVHSVGHSAAEQGRWSTEINAVETWRAA